MNYPNIHFLETRGILTLNVFEGLAVRVRAGLQWGVTNLLISCAASLAHHGLLGSVDNMGLSNVDLTSVPAEHLASLVSSVTGRVHIGKISGCDLVTVLDSVKSKRLFFYNCQSLEREETRALVRAMESHVEIVMLNKVRVDIRALMEYSGQGKCGLVECVDVHDRYRERLKTWATSRNWEVTRIRDDFNFRIERIGYKIEGISCIVDDCF